MGVVAKVYNAVNNLSGTLTDDELVECIKELWHAENIARECNAGRAITGFFINEVYILEHFMWARNNNWYEVYKMGEFKHTLAHGEDNG